MGRRRLIRHERQFQMIDNPIHNGILRDEGDDLRGAATLGAEHKVVFSFALVVKRITLNLKFK